MKQFFWVLAFFLIFAVLTVLACFDTDPSSLLGNESQTLTLGDGSVVDIYYVQDPGWQYEEWIESQPEVTDETKYTVLSPSAAVRTGFPFTLNLSFSGFVESGGGQSAEPVTRLILFYYAKSGQWMILKDIQNPQYTVVTEEGKSRALFGRHAIPASLGYSAGEYIPVVFYFRSASHESFSLNTFLNYRQYRGAPNFAEGASVLAVIVKNNRNPY